VTRGAGRTRAAGRPTAAASSCSARTAAHAACAGMAGRACLTRGQKRDQARDRGHWPRGRGRPGSTGSRANVAGRWYPSAGPRRSAARRSLTTCRADIARGAGHVDRRRARDQRLKPCDRHSDSKHSVHDTFPADSLSASHNSTRRARASRLATMSR
jgi:hypothetical protein